MERRIGVSKFGSNIYPLSMNTLKISNLHKTYANGVKALDDVTLEIPTGMYLAPTGQASPP